MNANLLGGVSLYCSLAGLWLLLAADLIGASIALDIWERQARFTAIAASMTRKLTTQVEHDRVAAQALASAWTVAGDDFSRLARSLSRAAPHVAALGVFALPGATGCHATRPGSDDWVELLQVPGQPAPGDPAKLLPALQGTVGASAGPVIRRFGHNIWPAPVWVTVQATRIPGCWIAVVGYQPTAEGFGRPVGLDIRLVDANGASVLLDQNNAASDASNWKNWTVAAFEFHGEAIPGVGRIELSQRLSPALMDAGRLQRVVSAAAALLLLFVGVGVLHYRSERRQWAEGNRLFKLANFDALTDLPNRLLFANRLENALAQAIRSRQPLAVLYLDLDGFKGVNDFYGHAVGDLVLQRAAGIFKHCVRDMDTVARLGGDEFAILLPSVSGRRGAESVARKIKKAFLNAATEPAGPRTMPRLGTSVGVALFPTDGRTAAALLKAADQGMYRDKAASKEVEGDWVSA